MTGASTTQLSHLARSAAERASGLMIVWIVLSGSGAAADLLPGALAALAATWASLRLLPPGENRVRPVVLAKFALRFLGQSVIAGADVARRALDPRLPLNPGFAHYPVGLPPGPARNTFTTLMSLLPGTVPIGPNASGSLVIHCLDAGQPVTTQLADEEARLVRVMGRTPGGG